MTCRSSNILQNEHLLANIGLDPAENEPSEVSQTLKNQGHTGQCQGDVEVVFCPREPVLEKLRATPTFVTYETHAALLREKESSHYADTTVCPLCKLPGHSGKVCEEQMFSQLTT